MTHENKLARLAGLLYFIVVVAGMFRLVYVPSQIMVPDDTHATINHIVGSPFLFRAGIAAALVEQALFLFLSFVLFHLLQSVGKRIAVVMVTIVAINVAITLVAEVYPLNVLGLLTDAHHGQGFTAEQLGMLVRQSFDSYYNGLLIAELFWGLWLLPFGYLVLRSGFLPKILGIFLMLGGLSYFVEVFGSILFSGYSATAISNYVTLPAAIGEIGTCLWLLLLGVRHRTLHGPTFQR